MSQTCTRCGAAAEDVALYCSLCGTALPDEDPAYSTGVLGLRVAHEGDSAPMPPVTETTVGQLDSGQAMLVVLRGPQEGARYVLDPADPVIVIGRTPECELFLDDVTVSRHHAELHATSGGWEIADAGSLNGSYVNRHRIERQALVGGDEVQIGKYRFVYLESAANEGGQN